MHCQNILGAGLTGLMLAVGWTGLAHAQQQTGNSSDWQWSAGIKAWSNQWDSWNINRVQIGANAVQIVEPVSSDQTVAFVPVVSARRGDWSLSASAMSRASYSLRSALSHLEGSRHEADVHVGWSVMQGVSLTGGVKQLTQDAGGHYVWRGPVLGASATAPLSARWALYGNLGLGRMKLALPTPDADGQRKLNASYAVSEVGAAYTLGPDWRLRQGDVTLAIAYRSQTVRTKSYALSSQPVGGGAIVTHARDELRDSTQGLTLSLLATF